MIEKYKNDKKYRNKVQLIGYGIFLIIAIIFASAGRGASSLDEIMNNYTSDNISNYSVDYVISLFDKYTYNYNVNINEKSYVFSGEYNDNILTINKVDDDNTIRYEYKNNNYYLVDTNEIVNENIYNPVDSKYFDIDLINQYLSKAKYEDNIYKVYLKDIILGNTSEEYITISYTSNLNEININVDYTKLLNNFNNDIKKYLVTMKYNKIID